jgi:hypothetical protein
VYELRRLTRVCRCALLSSLDEWLEFSSMLSSLSREEFDAVIGRYIEGVRKEIGAGK